MWYAKTYPSQREMPGNMLRDEFRKLVAAGGADAGRVGVFIDYPPGSRAVTCYFSPEAAALARLVGAEPCAKPELRHGMDLFVGGTARPWRASPRAPRPPDALPEARVPAPAAGEPRPDPARSPVAD